MAADAKKHTVLIGLDGVPHSLVMRLAEKGIMPRLAELIRNSECRRMMSSIPEISSVAWSSMMTGTGPGTHGIFGFTELRPGSYALTFPNFRNLAAEPFWKSMNRAGRRTCIINMPSTYPAAPLDGILVAGFVAIDLEKSAYPASLVPLLREMEYETDVNAEIAHSDIARFMEHVNSVFERRMEFCRRAWKQEDWDCFVFVVTETDRVNHFLFPALLDESHPFHAAASGFYARVDGAIGEIAGFLSAGDRLAVMSDHGFCSIKREIYVNARLRSEGFLMLDAALGPGFEGIAEGTRAFALDPCRIYLNRKGERPRGCVQREDESALLDELRSLLESWEWNGAKIVKRVYGKDEIYSGPLIGSAPDLVAVPNDGFDLKATLRKDEPDGRSVFAGMHTGDDALLVASGFSVSLPGTPCVSDVRGILESN